MQVDALVRDGDCGGGMGGRVWGCGRVVEMVRLCRW